MRSSDVLTEGAAERLQLARALRTLRARLQNSTDELTSMQNRKNREFKFRALLAQNGTRQLDVMSVYG